MHRSMPSTFIDSLFKREYKDNISLNKKIVNDRLKVAQNLYNKNFLAHYGCVNAIEFLNGGQFLASGGDDQRVLLWNVHEVLQGIGSPHVMRSQHSSNIFCIGYDSKNTKLFSSGNDDQVIVHDIQTGNGVENFLHEQPVYGLSVDPMNDNVFASACDDGRIFIYDIRQSSGSDPFELSNCSGAYHGVMYNPVESRLLATANAKEGASLWDIRIPHKALLKYGSSDVAQACMNVRWNSNGTQLLALRRRLPPVLYSIESTSHIAQFDHPGYFNSCTMKSCCFAGYDDEYVLSGSDDFNLYMWKLPSLDSKGVWVSSAHLVLGGHRSIVNQVRFNADSYLIASSGVEKLIKVWSPFPLPYCSGGLNKDTAIKKKRKVFSHDEYVSLVFRSGQMIDHDYSQESTKEDPRMMAFFDSLVQREIEGWTSDDSHSDPATVPRSFPLMSEQSLSDSSSSVDQGEGDGDGLSPESTRRKDNVSNPIVELIAKKRAQLMRLALNNQNSYLRTTTEAVMAMATSSRSSSNNDSSAVSDLTTASASDTGDDSDSKSDTNNNNCKGKLNSGRGRNVNLRMKRVRKSRKLVNTASTGRYSTLDSSEEDQTDRNNTPPTKRRKWSIDSASPNTSRATNEATTSAATRMNDRLASLVASVPQQLEEQHQVSATSIREGETPDSGIYLLSDEQATATTSLSIRKRSNSNRNYRKRIINSDSE